MGDQSMNANRIRLVLGFDIHEGKLSEFEAIAKQMVAASEKEPGTICYSFVLSADRMHCRLVEGYSDIAAITAHFKGAAVQQFVPQLLKVANLTVMDFYGDPGPEVTAMAAPFHATVFKAFHGFDR
jgi:quinol monooxygenase YgiN